MAMALASHYGEPWVPEYGRAYTESKLARTGGTLPWTSDEFVHIAEQQLADEDLAAATAGQLLVCDTDALTTAIWHELYLGPSPPELLDLAGRSRFQLYLLTGCEIPFEQDEIRDGEHARSWMNRRLEAEIRLTGTPHLHLEGPHEVRLARAVSAIDRLLSR